jgi:hypothetical protein
MKKKTVVSETSIKTKMLWLVSAILDIYFKRLAAANSMGQAVI